MKLAREFSKTQWKSVKEHMLQSNGFLQLLTISDHLGPELSGTVYEICCLASGLEAAERQFQLVPPLGTTGFDNCPE